MEAFIKFDHAKAIKNEYELDERILNQATNQPLMHSYLHDVFFQIVQPMINRLKSLMLEFSFCSEAEIFASDCKNKMFDS